MAAAAVIILCDDISRNAVVTSPGCVRQHAGETNQMSEVSCMMLHVTKWAYCGQNSVSFCNFIQISCLDCELLLHKIGLHIDMKPIDAADRLAVTL